MNKFLALVLAIAAIATAAVQPACAQDTNLLPKYGNAPKNEALKVADQQFLATVDERFKGDRKKASAEFSTRGWDVMRQGKPDDAMRRFNQAWLLDHDNPVALWGMAAYIGQKPENTPQALMLFKEAEPLAQNDIDFSVDYAKTMGMAGAQSNDKALLKDAFSRFEQAHKRAPQHVMNLQNWAITLYYVGDYARAWDKIKLAEATPRKGELDPAFLAALQAKMPRPQ